MQIIKHNNISIKSQLESGRSVLALISFDGEKCIVGKSDDLLECADINGVDIKKCYRIVFNIDCADWDFSCPPDYKGIPQEQCRKIRYYKDGLNVIGGFLSQIGLFISIQVNETNDDRADDAWIERLRKKWTQIVQENTYSDSLGENGYIKMRLTKNYFHVYAFVMSQLDYGLRAYLFPRLIACATPDDNVKKLISYLIQDESINVPDSIRQAAAKNGLQDMTLKEILSKIKPTEKVSGEQGEKLDYDKWRNRFLVEKYVDLGKALEDLSQKEAAKQIAEAEEDESQNIRDRLRDAGIDGKTIRELTSREKK